MVAPIVGSGIALLLLLHSLINSFLLRSPSPRRQIEESVAVLLPCRNEAHNVIDLLETLQAQEALSHLEIILLDDNSTDNTLQLAREHADPRTKIIEGAPLPEGWLGKPFACHQLSQATTADVLVFLDADVRLHPSAIARAVATLRDTSLALVSPYPRQVAGTWSERLVQPLLQWSWLSTLPLRVAERTVRPSLSAANGQFLVVDARSYRNLGGHAAIKDRVLDDLELLKALKKQSHRGVVIDGSDLATCRMYNSWAQLEMGYTKWLWAAFGSLPAAILASLFLFITYLLPLVTSIWLALICYLAGVLSRIVAALRTKGSLMGSLLHPLSIALLIYLILRSWWRKYRRTAQWKERTV